MISEEITNLLIVDDKADNLMALEMALERNELAVFTTTVPQNAVEICIDNDISIAMIDVEMPGMDGFELLDMIKKNPLTAHILVILITGHSMNSEHVVKGLSKGAVDYLFKPLDLYITGAKVNSLITLVNYQKEIENKNKELENYQQELYKAIEATEKSKVLKENFLANMSHEIRTPLNAIIGLMHLLRETPIDDQQQEMIKLMDYSAQSLIGIVNDILESAKIDAGVIEIKNTKTDIIDLIKTVCELTEPMAQQKGLKLISEIDPDMPAMIMADSLRLNQIMMNLINNSIKFTEKGSITISLRVLEKNSQSVYIEIAVKDTGIGISNSSISNIFTRFEQVEDKTWQKFGGTGLGLSIVKRLVELKGGELDVKSDVGVGTVFTIRNWYDIANNNISNQTNQYQLSDLPELDNILVLLAEDNVSNQFVMTEMLKKWNVQVDVAMNGLEAFDKLNKNNYNLILMDMHMPVMNGNDATRKIRKEMNDDKKNIPIICFSASVIQKERDEAKNAGVDDFIEKPFDPLKLHSKIKKLVIQKRTAIQNI